MVLYSVNAQTDTHNILGHITASGNISASGTIFASKFESAGESNEVISFNDNLNITGNITSSGDVSGSNISTGSFGNLRVSGLSVSDIGVLSSSIESRLSTEESNVDSLQTDSGSFSTRITNLKTDSGSISTRLTTEESNVDTLQSRVGQSLNVTDSPTFGGLTIQGKLTAETYAVSSSVTHMTRSFSSGSTIFGDDITDTHQFTGSLLISGSLIDSNIISGSSQLPNGIISGSSQLPSGIISGSTQVFTAVTSSGNISSSANIIGNQLIIGGGTFTSASLASGGGGGGDISYNGNRRILQTGFPTLFSASFNAGTSGSVQDFLDKVFFPNTPPSVSGSRITIEEFIGSGSLIGTITATDAEAISSDISFATQSGYTDDFFKIHSGSGQIRTNTSTSASFNTVNRGDGQLAHPFLIQVSDTITESLATIFIRVTPNTAPKFRTTSVAGSVINNQTGSVNENTTDGTQILEFFLTDSEGDSTSISPLSQSAANRFSLATANVAGGKRLRITTNTASFDFETIEKHHLEVSASDVHHGNTSGSYLTTLPILVNVTDNQAPTMASQVFSMNESSGSHEDNGLSANTNNLTTVGTITTNDSEGDG